MCCFVWGAGEGRPSVQTVFVLDVRGELVYTALRESSVGCIISDVCFDVGWRVAAG